MKKSWIFPGQASQFVGMGKDLFDSTDVGKKYYNLANDILEFDIQDISFNGPEEKLKITKFTQPAIFIVSSVISHLLKENGHVPGCVAGHSLGEYSALVSAGVLSLDDCLKILKVRCSEMQKANEKYKGAMLAVIHHDLNLIEQVCDNLYNTVIANINSDNQVIISGPSDQIKKSIKLFKDNNIKRVIKLNVSGAFHSPLMKSAKFALSEALDKSILNNSNIPVYSNVNAKATIQADEIRLNLKNQIDSPVLWTKTISNMKNDKATRMVEVGPGKVLQGLFKKVDRAFETDSAVLS